LADDPRVQELLEELLESGHTPEEACRHSPELLPQVLERWLRLHACDAQLDALFPESTSSDDVGPFGLQTTVLP
jgi:eukaryotic-like serine/threonine-protein kinase